MKQQSPSLALLKEMFPGQINIDFISAARVLGLAQQTAYNLVSAKKFPVKTFTVGKRRRACSILDLAATLDAQREWRRPGRPTKAEVELATKSASQ
jgi:hypothetical protein